MSEMNRVQRWRQQQRDAGKDALTIWLPRELKLYIEDMALKRHSSPSDLIQQALTTCYPLSAEVTDTVTDTHVTDTLLIRSMFQQELRAFFGESPHLQGMAPAKRVTVTVTDTHDEAEVMSATAAATPYVTDTVTDTHREVEAGRVEPDKTQHVTDTVTDTKSEPALDVTDTVTDTKSVTDTVTVTVNAQEPFDTSKYRLGTLCPRNHDYQGTGQSLRKNNKAGGCLACDAVLAKERRKAKREAPPVVG